MPGLLIKDIPPDLHRRLKNEAAQNRRSLTQQAIVLLEVALEREVKRPEVPPAFRGRTPLTDEFLDRAKREGRS